jgi:hypothetical protein
MRIEAVIRSLPELVLEVRTLKQKVDDLLKKFAKS